MSAAPAPREALATSYLCSECDAPEACESCGRCVTHCRCALDGTHADAGRYVEADLFGAMESLRATPRAGSPGANHAQAVRSADAVTVWTELSTSRGPARAQTLSMDSRFKGADVSQRRFVVYVGSREVATMLVGADGQVAFMRPPTADTSCPACLDVPGKDGLGRPCKRCLGTGFVGSVPIVRSAVAPRSPSTNHAAPVRTTSDPVSVAVDAHLESQMRPGVTMRDEDFGGAPYHKVGAECAAMEAASALRVAESFATRARQYALAAQNVEQLSLRVTELEDALRLVLPLAKGYAAANPCESSSRYVHIADHALASEPLCEECAPESSDAAARRAADARSS